MTKQDDQTQPSEVGDAGQPLIEHLIELRTRILHSLLSVVTIFLPLFSFANDLYAYISEPLRAYLAEGATMIATEVASPFLTSFKLTLVLAICIAIPFIFHQVWSFIAPGLYSSEKRLAVPLLASSVVLFYGGIAFAFYVVFPLIFGFFTSAAPAASRRSPPDKLSFLSLAVMALAFLVVALVLAGGMEKRTHPGGIIAMAI